MKILNRNKTRNKNGYPSILQKSSFQFIETYNALRTNIRYASANGENKKIVITSAVSGEGKSTVAINLAVSLANTNRRVLLVDCDFRKPALQDYLRIDSNAPGLTLALEDFIGIDKCILHNKELGIDVIPAGSSYHNPAELLSSDKMAEIVEALSKQYDYLLFDTSPVSLVTDAAILSKIADGVVLVIRQHHTTVEQARLAKKNLENVGASVIGTVLNAGSHMNRHESGYKYKQIPNIGLRNNIKVVAQEQSS